MTREEAATETVEINLFDDGRWHIKVLGVPVTQAVKRLREIKAAIDASPIQNAPARPQEARQPSQPSAPVSEVACPVHGSKRVKPSKFGSGGWYCTTKQPDGTYCAWKIEAVS